MEEMMEGLRVVIQELSQKVVAASAKLTKYEARTEQYVQNRKFQVNQKKLFEKIEVII